MWPLLRARPIRAPPTCDGRGNLLRGSEALLGTAQGLQRIARVAASSHPPQAGSPEARCRTREVSLGGVVFSPRCGDAVKLREQRCFGVFGGKWLGGSRRCRVKVMKGRS